MIQGIDADVIAGFTLSFLAAKYDNPKPIPRFHEEMWNLCCSKEPKVAIASPRSHGKSTAITHAFILAMMLLRIKSFCLLVSDTESQAAGFLVDIKAELESNEALRAKFGVSKLLKDTETNIIVQMTDGHKFRIQAKGSEQKVRGIKWMNKRPDLIVCDDLEHDEIVMNPDRREKFRHWFMNALIPCGSDTCWVRVVGTVMHLDSMLQRLLEDATWASLKFQAHNSDFTEILWPEQFSKERLLDIRAGYEAQNNLGGYSQEYLNRPVADGSTYFNKDYFFDFERNDRGIALLPNLEYFAAADFAISEKERADFTVIMVAGVDPSGCIYIVDVRRGRWDAESIAEELIATQMMWKPNVFTFEAGQIDKALAPYLNTEMRRRNVYMNIIRMTPTKSKTMRGRAIQGMVKSGFVRFDKEASWYPDLENELMTISDTGPRGTHDDHFDAFAYIGLTVDQYYEAQSDDELEQEAYDQAIEDFHDQGRCKSTGY
jgi:predicted phage terminase large subunit-like protein